MLAGDFLRYGKGIVVAPRGKSSQVNIEGEDIAGIRVNFRDVSPA